MDDWNKVDGAADREMKRSNIGGFYEVPSIYEKRGRGKLLWRVLCHKASARSYRLLHSRCLQLDAAPAMLLSVDWRLCITWLITQNPDTCYSYRDWAEVHKTGRPKAILQHARENGKGREGRGLSWGKGTVAHYYRIEPRKHLTCPAHCFYLLLPVVVLLCGSKGHITREYKQGWRERERERGKNLTTLSPFARVPRRYISPPSLTRSLCEAAQLSLYGIVGIDFFFVSPASLRPHFARFYPSTHIIYTSEWEWESVVHWLNVPTRQHHCLSPISSCSHTRADSQWIPFCLQMRVDT